MPCGSEAWNFVWWACGDNAGRSTYDFIKSVGCPDLRAYDKVPYDPLEGASWDAYYWANIRSHTQGVPPQLKGAKIISNTRNPYAKVVSSFADINVTHYDTYRKDLDFKEWVFEYFKNGFEGHNIHMFPWIEWGKKPFKYDEVDARPIEHGVIPIPYPNYHLRIEHLEEDILKIPEIVNNTTPELIENAIQECFRTDEYWENRRFVEYNKDGTLNWEPHIDQELADFIYAGTEKGFKLCGYDKDSWIK